MDLNLIFQDNKCLLVNICAWWPKNEHEPYSLMNMTVGKFTKK